MKSTNTTQNNNENLLNTYCGEAFEAATKFVDSMKYLYERTSTSCERDMFYNMVDLLLYHNSSLAGDIDLRKIYDLYLCHYDLSELQKYYQNSGVPGHYQRSTTLSELLDQITIEK